MEESCAICNQAFGNAAFVFETNDIFLNFFGIGAFTIGLEFILKARELCFCGGLDDLDFLWGEGKNHRGVDGLKYKISKEKGLSV